MFWTYMFACFGYKQQIADLEAQVQLNNAQLAVQQQAIEVLQERISTGTVPIDRAREDAAAVLIQEATQQLSDLAVDPSKVAEVQALFKQLEIKKGDPLFVNGSIQTSYEDKEGNKKTTFSIILNDFTLLRSKVDTKVA